MVNSNIALQRIFGELGALKLSEALYIIVRDQHTLYCEIFYMMLIQRLC